MPEDTRRYATSFKIFKPRKGGSGCASQWELNASKSCMFLEFADQIQQDKIVFDWANKVTMKLGLADIGDILATLIGLQSGMGPLDGSGRHKGIYHQTDKGNTILQLQMNEEKTRYHIRLSQKLQGKDPKAFLHAITFAESALLTVLLRRAVEVIHGWGLD